MLLLLLPSLLPLALAGIPVPRDSCHWLSTTQWSTELKCDGNEVAVGACSGGENKVATLPGLSLVPAGLSWGHGLPATVLCHAGVLLQVVFTIIIIVTNIIVNDIIIHSFQWL